MKVNLGWIGLIIIVAFFLYFAWYGKNVYHILTLPVIKTEEGFDIAYNTDGITLTSCPKGTKQFVNDTGHTICCDGQVDSGWCNGDSICSLSEGTNNIPSCSQWRAAYLKDKGRSRCPTSMPKYYEHTTGAGCTSGSLNADGSWPLNDPNPNYKKGIEAFTDSAPPQNKKCILYENLQDNIGKIDSCENVKLLEKTRCFTDTSIESTKELEITNGVNPPMIKCKVTNIPSNIPGEPYKCTQVSSYHRYLKGALSTTNYLNIIKDAIGWGNDTKIRFCNALEKNILTRTLTDDELSLFNPMTGELGQSTNSYRGNIFNLIEATGAKHYYYNPSNSMVIYEISKNNKCGLPTSGDFPLISIQDIYSGNKYKFINDDDVSTKACNNYKMRKAIESASDLAKEAKDRAIDYKEKAASYLKTHTKEEIIKDARKEMSNLASKAKSFLKTRF